MSTTRRTRPTTTATATATATTARVRGRVAAVLGTGVLLLGGLAACSSDDDSAASDTTTGTASDAASDTASGEATVTVTQPADGSPGGTGGTGSGDTGGGGTGSDGSGEGDGGSGGDACSTGMTGADAVAQWAGQVPPNSGNYPWNPAGAETDGYDPCTALSSVILPIEGGTASSPYQIMLFHDGTYIGTAASEAYGFYPEISRVDDATLSVTWHWPKDGESNAGRSGESTAQFSWEESSSSVAMTGDVPPV